MKKRTTKHSLFMSAIALLLCCSMLIGTTFAWFTDSVTSANNKIQSGTLLLDLEVKRNETEDWTSIKDSKDAIFNYEKWEPGYTDVKLLKIENEGTLALKWVAQFVSAQALSDLADAIDVYVKEGITDYPADRTDLTGWTKVGTVRSFVNTISQTTKGTLMPKGDANDKAYLGIALKMREEAGNEYQGLDLGGKFDIRIFATQLTYEEDSFNDQYDALAPWTGEVDTAWYDASATELVVDTAGELAGLAKLVNDGIDTFAGKTVKLGANIDLNNVEWVPIGQDEGGWATKFNGSFIGTGYTISNLYVVGTAGVGLFGHVGNAAHIEGVTIDGAYVFGNDYVGAVMGTGYLAENCIKNCTVKNATIIAAPFLMANGVYDGGAKAGAIAGYARNGNIQGNKAIDCTVTAYRDLGGIVGMVSGEDRAVTVSGNEIGGVNGVKLSYITIIGDYADNKPNENMDDFAGRKNNATVENNIGATENNNELSFVVSNDTELAAILAQVKANSNYWNQKITVVMNENTYSADHVINQYPEWNGVVGAGASANNIPVATETTNVANLVFQGTGNVVFTGNVTVNGFGNAGSGFEKALATTVFNGITFDAANSIEENGEDYAVLYAKAAANNVVLNQCTFKNATHIILGGSGADAAGAITVKDCTFNDGGCLSGYYETLNVENATVTAAKNGFINKSKSGNVTVTGGTYNVGKYFIRTSNSGVALTVNDADITMYESEEAKNLVFFRGSNESATFNNCTIAEGYTIKGVDADSTLRIYTEKDGFIYLNDGSGKVILDEVSADLQEPVVNVPSGVEVIGGYAFAGNSNIEKIVLPDTVTTLEDRAFRDTSASEVVLNEGIETIPYQTFRNALNVTSVEIPSTVKTIGKEAFQNSGITTLTLPATVTTIEYGGLRDMKKLKTVIIEGNVDIPVYAFRACTELKTVIIKGDDVTFGGGGRGMIFTNKENGDGTAITVYVANETVKERLLAADTAAKDYGGYTIVVDKPVMPSTENEFKEAIANGGTILVDGKIAVDEIGWLSNETNFIGNGSTISRDTGNGNALQINSADAVTFDDFVFESVKGNAVLALRGTKSPNVTIKNSVFNNLAAPSTGNTGIQVYAENATLTFENCTFNNMPIETNSSYPKGIKLVFNNCKFTWTGDNCPGMIKLANYVEADIDLNDCSFEYETNSQYTTNKNFIFTYASVGATTIDFNNFKVVGTRNNDNIWRLVGSGKNITVNTSGTLSYTFNGSAVDFATYLR